MNWKNTSLKREGFLLYSVLNLSQASDENVLDKNNFL